MNTGWFSVVFGGGAWMLWYGSLFASFLMLLGTAYYAYSEPSGPSAGPMLMLMVFSLGFVIMLIVTSVNVALWAGTAGYGFMTRAFFVLLTWVVVGVSWTFLFWATDPNYPEQLLPGRILFTLHSLLLYAGNLWLLWQIRSSG